MTPEPNELSRRERQIMDVLYELGRATAAEVRGRLPDPPSYSAVRAMLRILEDKGHLLHEQDGPRYAFSPAVPREEARESTRASTPCCAPAAAYALTCARRGRSK